MVIGVVLMLAFMSFSKGDRQAKVMTYSAMMQEAKNGSIERVRDEGNKTMRVYTKEAEYVVALPNNVSPSTILKKLA